MFGFIGLGDMGLPMARHLLEAGHPVVAWNRDKTKLAALQEAGAFIAPTPAHVMRNCDLIGLCLSSHHAVEEVCLGPEGLFAGAPSPANPTPPIVVDFSTGSPMAARSMAEHARAVGVGWVDAPVSGGPGAARTGTLTVFAGGEPSVIRGAAALLNAVAARITPIGRAGCGQLAKLCNQLIVSCNLMAVAEAIALGRRAGIDVMQMPAALKGGYADSTPLQVFGPRMAVHQFTPRLGAIELMEKDVRLAMDLADSLGVDTPMLRSSLGLFGRAMTDSGIDAAGDIAQLVLLFETGIDAAPAHEDRGVVD